MISCVLPRLRSAGVEILFDTWVVTSCSSKFPLSDGAPGRALSSLVMASCGAFIELIQSSNVVLASVSVFAVKIFGAQFFRIPCIVQMFGMLKAVAEPSAEAKGAEVESASPLQTSVS
jgi:hypothetical protein